MPEYGIDTALSDRLNFKTVQSENGPPTWRSIFAKGAIKSAEQKLCRSTHQKNPMMRFGYNECMVHHYAYMTRVVEVRDPESYTEAVKNAN